MELNYGMSLEQKQQLSQNQIQSLEVLAMDSVELSEFLQDEYLENPLLDYSEEHAIPQQYNVSFRCVISISLSLMWLALGTPL
mgnify:CR=1 FL=1